MRFSPRVTVFGDSVTAGVYGNSGPSACDLWTTLLTDETDYSFQNVSAPGNRICAGNSPDYSLRASAVMFNFMRGVALPKAVVLFMGTNDYSAPDVRAYTGVDNFHTDYRWILQYWKNNGVKVLCIPPLWRQDEAVAYPHPDGAWPLQNWRSWIADFATEKSALFLPHGSMGLAPCDFADGLHLNAAGHRKLADGVKVKLAALLSS